MNSKPPARKLSLLQKLIASYAAISLFTLATLVTSYTGLYSINRTARDIVTNDFVLIDTATALRESVLAQQSYAAKYTIIKGEEFRELYLQREKEFLEALQRLQETGHNQSFDEVAHAYQNFRGVTTQLFSGATGDPRGLKAATDRVTALLEKILADRQKLLGKKLEAARQQEKSTIRRTILLSFTGLLLALGVTALLIFNISTAVQKLKRATHRIAEGDFDFDPNIPPGDEVGALAEDFTRMAKRLKELEQISLDASPLTRLPGNIAIERVLERKLEEGTPFAVCYADLDNFKAYNDRYGYIQASDLIRISGEIIYETAHASGGEDVFVGHVGGDDFVMVVNPEKAAEVCQGIIEKFDGMIPGYYSPEDLASGGIEGKDRYGVHRSFPIMTISIAIVICQKGAYDSAVNIARAAAQLKDNLKGKAGSNYSINRRLQPR